MIHFFKSFLAVVVFSIVFNSVGIIHNVNAQYDGYYSDPTGYSYGDYYSDSYYGSSYSGYSSEPYYGSSYGGYSSEPYYGSSYSSNDYYSEPYYGSSSYGDYYSEPYYGSGYSSTYYEDYSYSSPSYYSSSSYYPTPSYYVAPTYSSYSSYSYPSSYSYSSPTYAYPASYYYGNRYYLDNESSNGALYVTCQPSSQNVPVGSSVTWNAYPNGGSGQYKITWSGDSVRNTGSTQVSARYTTPGTKSATVTVKTARDEMSAFCGTVNVYTQDYYDYYSPR